MAMDLVMIHEENSGSISITNNHAGHETGGVLANHRPLGQRRYRTPFVICCASIANNTTSKATMKSIHDPHAMTAGQWLVIIRRESQPTSSTEVGWNSYYSYCVIRTPRHQHLGGGAEANRGRREVVRFQNSQQRLHMYAVLVSQVR